jgi:hypothetical protein
MEGVAKHATCSILFAIAAKSSRPYLDVNDKRLSKRTLTGRLSPPLSLAPGQFLRPPCTAWGPYLFQTQLCPPFCPPRSASPVDKSVNCPLRDSKSMRPFSHQARTLGRKAGPETGKWSGKDRLQDDQIGRQPVARQEMRSKWWVRRKRISSAASRKWRNAG